MRCCCRAAACLKVCQVWWRTAAQLARLGARMKVAGSAPAKVAVSDAKVQEVGVRLKIADVAVAEQSSGVSLLDLRLGVTAPREPLSVRFGPPQRFLRVLAGAGALPPGRKPMST